MPDHFWSAVFWCLLILAIVGCARCWDRGVDLPIRVEVRDAE